MNANDLYDKYVNQADPESLLALGADKIAVQLCELDDNGEIADYDEAARQIINIARSLLGISPAK